MTTEASERPAAAATGRGRSALWWAVLAFALIVGVALVAANRSGKGDHAALGPQNPKASGARALARVLDAHGVDVEIVRNRRAFDHAKVDADTTVFVAPAERLSDSTAGDLRRRTSSAGALVVAGAEGDAPMLLGLDLDQAAILDESDQQTKACDIDLMSGLRLRPSLRAGDSGFDGRTGEGCFPGSNGSEGPYMRLWHTDLDGTDLWLLGDPGILSNADVRAGDNAAVALRLLGQHSRVVWYVPDPADVPPGDLGSPRAQLPKALFPALFLIVVAVIALMYARGRRLGRLVFEPLPVRIKAIESTLGRGRLYRRSGDRDHAAAVLRRATRVRLRASLKQPTDTPTSRLVDLVAARVHRDPAYVAEALGDAPVATDTELAELARTLATLEREARPR